jgi:hypothetical protein
MSSGPWEAYQKPAEVESGPWLDYQPKAAGDVPKPSSAPYIGSSDFRLTKVLKGIYDAAVGGATLPGDVYRGKIDPLSDEGIGRAFDLATFTAPTVPSGLASKGAAESSILGGALNSPTFERWGLAPKPSLPGVAADAPSLALPKADIVEAAERAGVTIPRVALMPNWMQKVGAGLSDLPIIGKPLQQAAERTMGEAQQSVGEVASGIGTASREGAATAIQQGVRDFKSKGIPEIEQEAFTPIREAIAPDQRFAAAETANEIAKMRERLGESSGKLSGEAARVQRALEENKGQLSFQALQDLRSALGAEMADKFNSAGYNDFVPRRLYGTLSDDMREAARAAGGDGLAGTWDQANATVARAFKDFKQVKSFGTEGGNTNAVFENAFALAMDKRGDLSKLGKLRQMVGPEEWGNVAATAVERMGKNNASDQFSMTFFTNSYDKMNPSARTLLFGEARPAIDDLATSFKALQNIERFKSKSQSANPLTVGSAAITGTAAGGALGALNSAVLGVTAYAGSKWLASPASSAAMARYAKNYEIFVRRPSDGLARSVEASAKRFGAVTAAEMGMPAAANDIARPLIDAIGAAQTRSPARAEGNEE